MLAIIEYVGADMAGKNDNRIPVADDKMFAKHAKPTYLEWDMPQGVRVLYLRSCVKRGERIRKEEGKN